MARYARRLQFVSNIFLLYYDLMLLGALKSFRDKRNLKIPEGAYAESQLRTTLDGDLSVLGQC